MHNQYNDSPNLVNEKIHKDEVFCSTTLICTGWVRMTIKPSLHCPCCHLITAKSNLIFLFWEKLGYTENPTLGRWVRSKYAINCAMRLPKHKDEFE